MFVLLGVKVNVIVLAWLSLGLKLVKRFYQSDPLNPNSMVRHALRFLDQRHLLDEFVGFVARFFAQGSAWLAAVINGLGL